jgi:hypothetical protein
MGKVISILYLPAGTLGMANSPFVFVRENLKRIESVCLIKETTALERDLFSSVSDTLPRIVAFCAKAGNETAKSKRTVSSFLIAWVLVIEQIEQE